MATRATHQTAARRYPRLPGHSAGRADEPLWPAKAFEVRQAGVLIGKPAHKLTPRARIVPTGDRRGFRVMGHALHLVSTGAKDTSLLQNAREGPHDHRGFNLLGGQKALGVLPPPLDQFCGGCWRAGSPTPQWRPSVRPLSRPEALSVLAVTNRTLIRRKREHRLQASESDRLFRLARVATPAGEVLEDREDPPLRNAAPPPVANLAQRQRRTA